MGELFAQNDTLWEVAKPGRLANRLLIKSYGAAQVKLEASLVSPAPLYFASWG